MCSDHESIMNHSNMRSGSAASSVTPHAQARSRRGSAEMGCRPYEAADEKGRRKGQPPEPAQRGKVQQTLDGT
jgi:hypothetical protein